MRAPGDCNIRLDLQIENIKPDCVLDAVDAANTVMPTAATSSSFVSGALSARNRLQRTVAPMGQVDSVPPEPAVHSTAKLKN